MLLDKIIGIFEIFYLKKEWNAPMPSMGVEPPPTL